MRNWWRKRELKRIQQKTTVYNNLDKSAMIIAPHPDDETLGCGGLIARKRQAGATVWVMFVSDGRHSHSHLLPAPELAKRRHQEAIAACQVLGVDEGHIIWLGIEDGQIRQGIDQLQGSLRQLLPQHQPEELFIPLLNDGPDDHEAAAEAVLSLVKNQVTYGYPIWAWHHWPFMPASPLSGRRGWLRWLNRSLNRGAGNKLYHQLTYQVDVTDVLAIKKQALEKHQSQINKQQKDWLTLYDVPQFLETLLTNQEYFQRLK